MKDSLTVSRSGENLSVIADAMPPPLSRGGLGIPQSLAFSPVAPLLGELSSDSETERLYKGKPALCASGLRRVQKYDLLRKYE